MTLPALSEDVFHEAVHRWWNDPELHARAVMAASLVEAREDWIRQSEGPDSIRDAMRMVASVALVLAERDPATGERLGEPLATGTRCRSCGSGLILATNGAWHHPPAHSNGHTPVPTTTANDA